MTRTFARLLAAATVVTAACTIPNEACGCSLVPPTVVVTGRVTDAVDAPVANARVALDAVPATLSSEPPFHFAEVATTGSDGSFVVRARNATVEGNGEMALRAGVVRAGTTDTVRLRVAASLRFVAGRSVPDTVKNVTVKLP